MGKSQGVGDQVRPYQTMATVSLGPGEQVRGEDMCGQLLEAVCQATLKVYHSLCGAFRSQPGDRVPRAS